MLNTAVAILWLLQVSSIALSLTLYTHQGTPSTSAISPAVTQSGGSPSPGAHVVVNSTRLTPPSRPEPPVKQVNITIPVDPNAAGLSKSVAQKGNFLGFSIELSVAESMLGREPRYIEPVFLNYMANIKNRAGLGPRIRLGGNTQEDATFYPNGLANGASVSKNTATLSKNPTATPNVEYSPQLLYTMSNITGLVGAQWYFGLSFNQSVIDFHPDNVPLAAKAAEEILGSSLQGLALGNEPDLYVSHLERTQPGWSVANYVSEFASVRDYVTSASGLSSKAYLMGPSVCCNVPTFELDDVLATGWLTQNINHLSAVSVQHYPTNNCQINGVVRSPQALFPTFLNHTSAQSLTKPYLNGSRTVQAAGKELVMLEFNSASCGGFAGLSDSFGAALWLTDWSLQLAWANFTAAMMHVGGKNVYYNPFTPPATKSGTDKWTTDAVYYSSLVVAEAFGRSGKAQVVDLLPNETNKYHPAYIIYEGSSPVRAVLFNYVDDPTGGSQYTAQLRYLLSPSVSEQYNITWAGQTLSESSNGLLVGKTDTKRFQCTGGVCPVTVPAPSIAIVYLTQQALNDSSVPAASSGASFKTTAVNTAFQGPPTVHVIPQGVVVTTGGKKKSSAAKSLLSARSAGVIGALLGLSVLVMGM